jgi:hypothetical protein
MVFEGYLKIDPFDPSYALPWTARSIFEDHSKFKDKSKHYILVVIRDTLNEAQLETDAWVRLYNEGQRVPNTLGEVWREYFEWSKATAHVRKGNGHLKLEAKQKLGQQVVKGKTGRPPGKYEGQYNIFNRKHDPDWTVRIKCTKCGIWVRKKLYELRHGDKCKCRPAYIKKADRIPPTED